MHQIAVGSGVYSNSPDAEFLQAQHAQGDLAAIGYEYFI